MSTDLPPNQPEHAKLPHGEFFRHKWTNGGPAGGNPLSKAKVKALERLPCDGVPRYLVKGSVMAVRICYAAAYDEIFELEGGGYTEGLAPGTKAKVWTKRAMKRILALNAQHRPHAARIAESHQAARELLAMRGAQATIADGPRTSLGPAEPPASVLQRAGSAGD